MYPNLHPNSMILYGYGFESIDSGMNLIHLHVYLPHHTFILILNFAPLSLFKRSTFFKTNDQAYHISKLNYQILIVP